MGRFFFRLAFWPVCLIVLGIILLGNSLGFFHINLFFPGWWTLFIIVPSFFGILRDGKRFRSWNWVCLFVGVMLLLNYSNVIKVTSISQFFFGGFLLIFSVIHLVKYVVKKKKKDDVIKQNFESVFVFGGENRNYAGQVFKGTSVEVFLGGVKLDLSEAIINEDVIVNVSVMLGGCDLLVPKTVNVKTSGSNFLGGVSNKSVGNNPGAPTIHVVSSTFLGGVDIKN